MNLFGLMETSGSAMRAERMRAEIVAANMANAETTRTELVSGNLTVPAANPAAQRVAKALSGEANVQ